MSDKLKVEMIVAVATNGVIGKNGEMPWDLPADLQYFKEKTMGHAVVMGRKTYESIGRPLPGRLNIVLSRRKDFTRKGVEVVSKLAHVKCLAEKKGYNKLMIIGGGEIYKEFRNEVDYMYLTHVLKEFDGDTYLDLGWDKRLKDIGDDEKLKDLNRAKENLSNFHILCINSKINLSVWKKIKAESYLTSEDGVKFYHIELKKKENGNSESFETKSLFE